MNTRKTTNELRMSHWAEIMQERLASGTSIRKYCESSGIQESVYYYWQRKLREVTCNEILTGSQMNSSAGNASLIPSGWASCEVTKPEAASAITIEINGCRVLVGSDVDANQLTNICRVLKSL